MSQPVRPFQLLVSLVAAVACACTPASQPETQATERAQSSQFNLQDAVEAARATHDLIALGAIAASSEDVLGIAVDGDRKINSDDPVQQTDRWHLGSTTKALTALLYGQLVERDLASWGATLPELFPHFATEIDPAWRNTTIEDLFAHRSGLTQLNSSWLIARRTDDRPLAQQREETVRKVLNQPPGQEQGSFDYNNLNYIIAGAAIETILRGQGALPDTWEGAMQTLVFDALEDDAARLGFGFGPPQQGLVGHRMILDTLPLAVGRGNSADNPAALGPAGTLNASLRAHAMLAREFLKPDSTLIPLTLRQKLWRPHPDPEADYAMGWGVYDDPTYGRLYVHSGSNTVWYTRIIIAPALDRLVIVNANQFNQGAQSAAIDITLAVFDDALSAQDP